MGRGTIPPDSPEFGNRSRRDALKQTDCEKFAAYYNKGYGKAG